MEMEVDIGKGYKIKIGEIEELPEGFIVTDENLANEYEGLLGNKEKFIMKPGEKSKNLTVYKKF